MPLDVDAEHEECRRHAFGRENVEHRRRRRARAIVERDGAASGAGRRPAGASGSGRAGRTPARDGTPDRGPRRPAASELTSRSQSGSRRRQHRGAGATRERHRDPKEPVPKRRTHVLILHSRRARRARRACYDPCDSFPCTSIWHTVANSVRTAVDRRIPAYAAAALAALRRQPVHRRRAMARLLARARRRGRASCAPRWQRSAGSPPAISRRRPAVKPAASPWSGSAAAPRGARRRSPPSGIGCRSCRRSSCWRRWRWSRSAIWRPAGRHVGDRGRAPIALVIAALAYGGCAARDSRWPDGASGSRSIA